MILLFLTSPDRGTLLSKFETRLSCYIWIFLFVAIPAHFPAPLGERLSESKFRMKILEILYYFYPTTVEV